MDNNIFLQKEALRAEIKQNNETFDPSLTVEADDAIVRRLAELGELRSATSVFCYVSTGAEVDTRKLIAALLRSGRRVFVPRIDGEEMVAVEIASTEQLAPGAYGIPEPSAELSAASPDEIEIAIIPGLAFGADGSRLGHGKGYYDRWLAAFKGTKCALARERELRDSVPHDARDERMNLIITDERTIKLSTAESTIEARIAEQVAATLARPAEDADEPLPETIEGVAEVAGASTEASSELSPEMPDDDEDEEDEKPRRRRWGCTGALIWLLCVIGISAALAGFGWMCADDLLALTAEDVDATIVVLPEDTVDTVADKLGEAEMIDHPWLYALTGKLLFHAEEKLAPGVYEVNALMDYRALINAMRSGSAYRATVDVTIPEGYTVEQILRRLADNGVNTYENLAETAANYDFEYSFLADKPLGDIERLEGYLFPNTHTFYVGESTVTALNKLLSDFSAKFDEDLVAEAEELGYTMHEVLTIASLIEKEAANNSEMTTISSVIHNRLNNWDSPKLQIDATIQYVLDERKEYLSLEDLAIDSPYNTYLYEGLPPGPICNPGLAAIRAALRPEETNYYFYALTEAGTHEFARTADEHQAIIDANPGAYGG